MTADDPSLKQKVIKYSSLGVLVLQNTSLVLFMRYAMTGDRPKFLKAVVVFFAEIFKCLASVVLVCCQHGSVIKGFQDLHNEFFHKKKDFAKVLVPAVIYTIQNFLLYVAVENLPAATFMVTYQLKILTTAIFTVAVLKRKLSLQQWIALFFLFAGVAIVQYDQKMSEEREKADRDHILEALNATSTLPPHHSAEELENAFSNALDKFASDNETGLAESSTTLPTTTPEMITTTGARRAAREENSLLGFAAVLTACIMSGFAGIYFEKILKTSQVSIWLRNVQLALPSIFFALLFAFVKDRNAIFNGDNVVSNMMHGFDWAVWVTVAINAFGGLVVAVVIKFADNILKAFATSFAIVFNCVLSYFLFAFRPSMFFVAGACMVIGAVFVYSLYPYKAPTPRRQDGEELADVKKKEETRPLKQDA